MLSLLLRLLMMLPYPFTHNTPSSYTRECVAVFRSFSEFLWLTFCLRLRLDCGTETIRTTQIILKAVISCCCERATRGMSGWVWRIHWRGSWTTMQFWWNSMRKSNIQIFKVSSSIRNVLHFEFAFMNSQQTVYVICTRSRLTAIDTIDKCIGNYSIETNE